MVRDLAKGFSGPTAPIDETDENHNSQYPQGKEGKEDLLGRALAACLGPWVPFRRAGAFGTRRAVLAGRCGAPCRGASCFGVLNRIGRRGHADDASPGSLELHLRHYFVTLEQVYGSPELVVLLDHLLSLGLEGFLFRGA